MISLQMWDRMLGREPPLARPEVCVLALGLDGSGKSTTLAFLAGESIEGINPTKGFHIKDIPLTNCILSVKEVGGRYKLFTRNISFGI